MTPESTFELLLTQKKLVADGVTELHFEKPAGLTFSAGQFIQFKIKTGETSIVRSYSISSSPADQHLEFCIKYVPEGRGSTFFQQLKPGEKVMATGPKGFFICADESASPKFFIATGVGLAPIIPMLEARQDSNERLDLLFGVREEKDLFWLERIEDLKKRFPNFNARVTLSRGSSAWSGLRGRVTDHVIAEPSGHYYLCGSVEMVKDVRKLLVEKGIPAKQMHFEIF